MKPNTCTISFSDEREKAKAFYELIHSGAQFNGIGKNTLVISKKDCERLRTKHIKYEKIS